MASNALPTRSGVDRWASHWFGDIVSLIVNREPALGVFHAAMEEAYENGRIAAVEKLDEAVKAARVFNRSGMTWLEYDRTLVELEQFVNQVRSGGRDA